MPVLPDDTSWNIVTDRRTWLAAGPLAFSGCGAGEVYFGRTDPPPTQRLVYAIEWEPDSIDPALSTGRVDPLMLSLFEGLTILDPEAATPMSALATHYDISGDGLRYLFYLRGHPHPAGKPLPVTDDLSVEFSRGRRAPPQRLPARWSDGTLITAHDLVYSWRRVLEPATAAPLAFLMYAIRNAREINGGKLPPERLGANALDNFTLQVELRAPAPYFLELVSSKTFCPAPRHIIEKAGNQWTEAGQIVSNGAFIVHQRQPNEQIVLRRNPYYYDAGQVALSELIFVIVPNGAAVTNLYRSGALEVVQPSIPAILPALRNRKDFQGQQVYASSFLTINIRTPPLDDVRVRWALNMATDKRPLAELEVGGSVPAHGLVPPTKTYTPPSNLQATAEGTSYDILSFNPHAARDLLQRAGRRLPRRLEYVCPNVPDSRMVAQILQDQWRMNLGIELGVIIVELELWIETIRNGNFRHIAESGSAGAYIDPAWFLELFASNGGYGSGWGDPEYQSLLAKATTIVNPALRLAKLADCERHLLLAMPLLPVAHEVWPILKKPFVKGFGDNLLGRPQFKYVWIDTKWRPQ